VRRADPALRVLRIAVACAALGAAPVPAQPPDPAPPVAPKAVSSVAEAVYAAARPRLIQIRTLVSAAGRQSSIGSGFFVSADGLALTNYHVVSQFALEPATYRLEYVAPDGTRGDVRLVAIDVVNDLAAVRIDRKGDAFSELDERAVAGTLPQGERLFALGNPRDLGFTIAEGTYNGFVDRSYTPQVNFSGAITPGMSGGPTVTVDGRVAGVNVARIEGDLISFLVPANAAAALIDRARHTTPLTAESTRAEIARQLDEFQRGLAGAFVEAGFKPARYGDYIAPESQAAWIQCWASTNADARPAPRARLHATHCSTRTSIFLASDLATGVVATSYAYAESISLNAFQFASFLTSQLESMQQGAFARRRMTRQRCHEDFLAGERSPLLRATFCARAYRDFPGLYDVAAIAVTQDDDRRALVARLTLSGVSWDSALAYARRFYDGIGRAP
jgi:S1-C subfamily serine protease